MAHGKLTLNPGAQEAFVNGEEQFSAYIGGLGSGKTYAGIARGLKYALQPRPAGVFHAPFGVIAAANYPSLKDIILPKLEEIVALTGLADWETDYHKSDKELWLKNGARIRLRSLDQPNWQRGPEYTWFMIDEGRNVTLEAWKIPRGRLRQEGYARAGFVSSTPNGFDWMYDVFHEEGALHADDWADARWYNAPMRENVHLDESYLSGMEANYSGRFYQQEVLGEFVGIVEGGVFNEWDPEWGLVEDLEYRPELPLYTFWDFGVGDPGICVFAQVDYVEGPPLYPGGERVKVPELYILEAIEAKDWTAKDWADAYHTALADSFRGVKPKGDYGDPAGLQRNPSTGTSVIADLNALGVPVMAAPKKPQDYAIRILQNMMAGERVKVSKRKAKRVSDAFSSHKWHLDANGVRVGVNPVHDWTSHFVDAVRYGAAMLLSFNPLPLDAMAVEPPGPNTYGHVFDQLLSHDEEQWLGAPKRKRRPTFSVEGLGGRS